MRDIRPGSTKPAPPQLPGPSHWFPSDIAMGAIHSLTHTGESVASAAARAAHWYMKGNRDQVRYEKIRARTYQLQGGPGGTKMPYEQAKAQATREMQRGLLK